MSFTRDAVYFGSFAVRWYGVLIALGVLAAFCLCQKRTARFSFPKDTALDLALVSVPAGIVGARLYYAAFSWENYRGDLLKLLNLREGGLAIYGGLIAGLLAILIYAKKKKFSFPALADLISPAVALAQGIGRWGNFLNGEAYGVEVKNEALRFFPLAVNIEGTWHCAAFFYESLWCVLVCLCLLTLEKKKAFKDPGSEFLSYAFLYAFERFFTEGIRTDSLMFGNIRISRLLSAFVCLLAGILLIYKYLRRKKGYNTNIS